MHHHKINVFYRISDKSYVKDKLPGTNKRVCLLNFLDVFQAHKPFEVIADNCNPETEDWLDSLDISSANTRPVKSCLGNAGSLYYALLRAETGHFDQNDVAYMVEDDYLHQPIAPQLLAEGLEHTDYVTLYDHPDKYTAYYDEGETSKVIRTSSSHWRYTISTCMTFAARHKTIREDMPIWEKWLKGKVHPDDHQIFCNLHQKKRRLAVCIPGAAYHIDLTFSRVVGYNTMEPWAMAYARNCLLSGLDHATREKAESFLESSQDMPELKQLACLESLVQLAKT